MTEVLLGVLGLVAVVALTIGTFIAVAAEFSLTALERSTVESHLAAVGDAKARTVDRAHRALSFQLSGSQLAITFTTLITGYIAEPAIAHLVSPALGGLGVPGAVAGPISLVVALALATALSMVFGELVPKNLAIARPLETARAVAGVQAGFSAVFRWLITGLNGAANRLVRALGVEPAEELASARSPQELGALIRSSAEHGTIDPGTATLLDRSLRFGDRTADELMTPRVRVESLRADATVLDLLARARETGFSRFPVHHGDLDEVRGIVHVKQAFNVPRAQRATTPVSALTRPVQTVPETLPGDALLDRLRASGLQSALVVDEYGGTAGLVTLEDLVEEIVGDVRDEHDRRERAPVRSLGRDRWLLSGLLRDDEVFEATGFRMPPGDYETLAGLVLARLGRIPDVGDEIRVDGWRVTVVQMDRHRVAELRVESPSEVAR
ncbi:hemolysin family protein [Saccharothrix algeriensis]|uniref:CBS domain containing-hemolysin-like protein n=1 Tax=Saccharothrix algeriensis TaxID=173560 RepID=A0A8T8HV43_9PSEU|nr:hemolysin family protein [Saccharothrix algeriensis]MBM7813920.1 CBS domain containing-hemolysin-like protein [Saccharothrix algeriensis]QTR02346.1 HlyC/CorC family transporter [Saccharothrix algeriensis]